MNLYRFVKGIGVKPVLCGNIKGLHDPYRNPTTQQDFARRWKQKPHMVTSLLMVQRSHLASYCGQCYRHESSEARDVWPNRSHGHAYSGGGTLVSIGRNDPRTCIVDYVVGAVPSPGVFVLGTHDHPAQKHYLNLYKLGDGFYIIDTLPSLPL